MTKAPKIGTVVKFHVYNGSGIVMVLGRVEGVIENNAFIDCGGEKYTRNWSGLIPATSQEEVLWRFEQ